MSAPRLTLAAAGLLTVGVLAVVPLAPASAQGIEASAADKFLVNDPNPQSNSGYAVAVSGDTAVVGAPRQDISGNPDTGAAYVFTRLGSTWVLQARLTSGGTESDEFGTAVAISGDTVVVGAPMDDVTPTGTDIGAAYVFTRSGSTWSRPYPLTAAQDPGDTTANNDWFGTSVAISGDTLLVGTPGYDQLQPERKGNAGAVYTFVHTGENWLQHVRLSPSENAYFYQFGRSVALSGETALIGAPGDPSSIGADGALDIGRAWVFTRAGCLQCEWTQQAKLTDPEGVDGDLLGWSVALEGDTAVVGDRGDDDRAGAAFVYTRVDGSWGAGRKIVMGDRQPGDLFGESVAIADGTVVIGAPMDDSPAGGGSGSAHVFTESAGAWVERASLMGATDSADDDVGRSVAVSGGTVVIGAPLDDPEGIDGNGAARVFTGSGATWTQQADLIVNGVSPRDRIGESVSISGDTALLGAPGDDSASGKDTGSVFVMVHTEDGWIQQAKLTSPQPSAGREFGAAVAISADLAVIGAPAIDPSQTGSPGAAYVFIRDGSSWSYVDTLTASDAAVFDAFGVAVAIDGDTAVVGARGDDSAAGINVGSAYVFARDAGGDWIEQGKLTSPDAAAFDLVGSSVALSGDTAIVGAPRDDTDIGADVGSATVFTRTGSTWAVQQKLSASDGQQGDRFGVSVSLAGDTALVGAPNDPADSSDTGSAYLFDRSGETWQQQPALTAPDGEPFDTFGSAVALSPTFALIGAPGDSEGFQGARGSMYGWIKGDTGWAFRTKVPLAAAEPGNLFGAAVALDGDDAVVSTPGGSTATVDGSGAVYGLLDMITATEPPPPNDPPAVTAKAPTSSAAITGAFTATFSEPVTGVSAATFTLKVAGSGTAVSGTVSQPTSTTARFTPAMPLMPGQSYIATLTTDIKDLDGAPLASNVSWTVRTATIVDSTSVALREVWDVDKRSAASGGAYAASPGPGSRKSFSFTGTNVSVYGVRSSSGGYADVYLDGARKATVSCYASSAQWKQVLFSRTGLANAQHTIEVRPKGTKPSASHGTQVYVDAFKVGSSFYQENHSAVRDYFRRLTTTSAFGGSYDNVTHASSSDTGGRPTFTLRFKGSGVAVYGTRTTSSGSAVVYIDGAAKATISFRGSSTAYRVPVFSANLSNVEHTISIVVLGTSSGVGSNVGIDYFIVK